ncbi:MAG TPA: FixH family protein [Anaerolineales bacterium]|nr:FixH family protein [Anaerolineales bacterium]
MIDTTTSTLNNPVDRRRILKWITGTVCAVLIAAWVWLGFVMLGTPERDYSTTRMSEGGVFQATIVPDSEPIPVNKIHTWTLHVETPDGAIVENAEITLDGDMPEHGHGLPTRPEVTRYLGNGDYLVEGLKFQMTGWWVMDFDITANGETDRVRFNLQLN